MRKRKEKRIEQGYINLKQTKKLDYELHVNAGFWHVQAEL